MHNVLTETNDRRKAQGWQPICPRNAPRGLLGQDTLDGSRQSGGVKYGTPSPKLAPDAQSITGQNEDGCKTLNCAGCKVPCLQMDKVAQTITGPDAQSITGQNKDGCKTLNCAGCKVPCLQMDKVAQTITGQVAQTITGQDAQSITGLNKDNCKTLDCAGCKVPCLETDNQGLSRKTLKGAGVHLKTSCQEMTSAIWHLFTLIWLNLWFPVTWFYPGKSQGDLDDNQPRISMTDPAYLAMSAKEHQRKLRTFIPVKPRWEFAYPAVRGSEYIHPHTEKDLSFTSVTSGNFVANASTATEMNHASTSSTAQRALALPELEVATPNMCLCCAAGPRTPTTHIVTMAQFDVFTRLTVQVRAKRFYDINISRVAKLLEMYLGIDLGTSSVKIVLIDGRQRMIGTVSSPLSVSNPKPGWSEQDAAQWIQAVEAALTQLSKEYSEAMAKVKSIGLSGQMHGATLLDCDDRPLRPCILWNDTRSHAEAAAMNAEALFLQITGNLVFPAFTAPKLAWVRKNEPEVFAAVAKVLLPKDYLRLWLTGEYVTDMSDAAGTSWLDVQNRQWSPELLALTGGLSIAQMPRLVEGTQKSAILKPDLAKCWGIGGGAEVIVAGGAGDNATSACGVGSIRPGTAFLSLGTSGVLFTTCKQFPLKNNAKSGVHTFCHALPNTWHQMGVCLSATDSLNWLAKVTGVGPSDLVAELGEQLKPPTGVIFLPYLSGERTPHNDAQIRGAFVGLSHQTDRCALTQAVLEGVAFAFCDLLEALQQSSGDTENAFHQLVAIGGGSRSIYWLKAIATALGIPLLLASDAINEFGAAIGAARLGLIAVEGLDPLEVCMPPENGVKIEPYTKLKAEYEEAYRKYRALYPALKDIFCPGI